MTSRGRYRRICGGTRAAIEIRVEKITQLFDTLDPFPYPRRDLAQSAEDFIVGWARELPRSQPIEIIVHLPAPEAEGRAAQQLSDALSNYFRYRAERLGLDLRELFRVGRWSLLIGLTVLAACVILGQYLAGQFDEGYLNRFFNEGLIILGSQLEADGDIPL